MFNQVISDQELYIQRALFVPCFPALLKSEYNNIYIVIVA
jgi:hypothetical protein